MQNSATQKCILYIYIHIDTLVYACLARTIHSGCRSPGDSSSCNPSWAPPKLDQWMTIDDHPLLYSWTQPAMMSIFSSSHIPLTVGALPIPPRLRFPNIWTYPTLGIIMLRVIVLNMCTSNTDDTGEYHMEYFSWLMNYIPMDFPWISKVGPIVLLVCSPLTTHIPTMYKKQKTVVKKT